MAVVALFLIFGDGLAVLASLIGSAVALLSVPVLWLRGKRATAGKVLAGWGIFAVFYLALSTGLALFGPTLFENPRAVGQEVCADSGCFAVEKVDKVFTGQENEYTLFWHLASTDARQPKRFPGKGLELYMFDERCRTFRLADTADPNPLDVTLGAGETVRRSITFRVPSDTRQLFLTAKYRSLTYQSLFPGELSLVPNRCAKMIRIE
jgi:hypothetical protein